MQRRSYKALQGKITGWLASFLDDSFELPTSHAPQIASFRLRLGSLLVARECLRLFFAWIMIWAAAVVGLRAVFRVEPLLLLWGLLGLAAAAAVGLLLALRKVPSAAAIRAVLDRHGCLGGLLMAAGDTDIGPWQRQLVSVPMPALRWRAGRQGMLLLTGVAFLVAAFLAPDRYLASGQGTALQVGGEMQRLTDKIQVLKQEQILPPDKAKVLEKDLDRIRREALGKDPAKTMEAIDHLEQSFSKAAADAAESAIKHTETASKAQELAAALQTAQGQMDPKQFGEAMKELGHMADEAAAESNSLADGLSDKLKKACREGAFTPEQLQKLSEALKGCKASERARLLKLVKARLVDAGELALCEKAGELDPEGLIAVLGEDGKESADSPDGDGLPGRGGLNRGRGDAAMTWQQGVGKEDAAFKEKVLPPAAMASLKKSRLVGVSSGDPTAKKSAGGSSGGALAAAQAGGGEARTQTILPEHEKTVERYFSREKK